MAVSSKMLPLGTPLPTFTLPDTISGKTVSSSELAGRPALVAIICNHCPYVRHIQRELAKLGRECQEKGVGMVAISANDPASYPDDAPDKMAEEARQAGYVFPYLFDESQAVAKRFNAACTPEFYLFDARGLLAYRGQFDDSRPKNDRPVTGQDLRRAVEDVVAGRSPAPDQKPSIGCSIKWRAGNEPT